MVTAPSGHIIDDSMTEIMDDHQLLGFRSLIGFTVLAILAIGLVVRWLLNPGHVSRQAQEEEALMTAVAENNIPEVQRSLAAGVDPDCTDDEMSTCLHVASFCGHTEIVKMILKASTASIEKPAIVRTPLHVAASARRVDVVKLLLEARACVDARDESELTPLHRAARAGCDATVQALLSAGASIEAQNVDLYTPLHCACMGPTIQLRTVELLLRKGALKDACTANGETAADLLRRAAARELSSATAALRVIERDDAVHGA